MKNNRPIAPWSRERKAPGKRNNYVPPWGHFSVRQWGSMKTQWSTPSWMTNHNNPIRQTLYQH